MRLLVLLALGLILAGCNRFTLRSQTTTTGPTGNPPVAARGEAAFAPETHPGANARPDCPRSSESNPPDPTLAADLWTRVRAGFRLKQPLNPRTERELRRLTGSPHHVRSLLKRGEPYFYLILEQIERRSLPAELALLPAVESAYRPTASSYSGAAGLWQIMPATGRRAGLRLDEWYDGRRDVFDSTAAALDLLARLNARLDGDWLHTLAAYNAGPGRLSGAIRRNTQRGASTSFWDLQLPGETDAYIPRLLALAEIVAHPDRYGVELPEIPNTPRLKRIDAGGRTDLRVAARVASLDSGELLSLNAGYKALTTLPEGPHWIVVPAEAAERLRQGLAGLRPGQRMLAQDLKHRIRRGETLGGIARRYGVSVAALKRANHLRGHLIRTGRTLMIPGRPRNIEVADSGVDNRIQHRVRKGDSLYRIARRYKVSIDELRRWNGINGKLIRPGQRLTVFVSERTLSL